MINVVITNGLSLLETALTLEVIHPEPKDLQVMLMSPPDDIPSCIPKMYNSSLEETHIAVFKDEPFSLEASVAIGNNLTFTFDIEHHKKTFIHTFEDQTQNCSRKDCRLAVKNPLSRGDDQVILPGTVNIRVHNGYRAKGYSYSCEALKRKQLMMFKKQDGRKFTTENESGFIVRAQNFGLSWDFLFESGFLVQVRISGSSWDFLFESGFLVRVGISGSSWDFWFESGFPVQVRISAKLWKAGYQNDESIILQKLPFNIHLSSNQSEIVKLSFDWFHYAMLQRRNHEYIVLADFQKSYFIITVGIATGFYFLSEYGVEGGRGWSYIATDNIHDTKGYIGEENT
ncbi:hypothetical protein KUTeg_008385 [Tegillarca granosa]|uniref:Uncharacterized protein n=1 Tax=Tegillarca granosa TaxID=220873 RepID=A0ABQ9F907_TEGGR|nr:hypothetical protein KUTeg_008385 [Tegillarca granosa]